MTVTALIYVEDLHNVEGNLTKIKLFFRNFNPIFSQNMYNVLPPVLPV